MSQVTEQSVRFQTALASIKLIQASAVLDLTEDDFDFLTSNKVWIATDALVLVAALRLAFMVVPSFVSGAMAKAGKGLLEGTLQAGTSAVSDKLLDLVGLGGKSAADKGKDTRD